MHDFEVKDMDWVNSELTTGTTIMAAEFKGGVVLAADSRATKGSYVSYPDIDKLTQITDFIYVLRSGSAAHTQRITDVAKSQLGLLEMELGGEPMSVKIVADEIGRIIYNDRNYWNAGMIVAGWDSGGGGQVYNVPKGGMVTSQKVCVEGSGREIIVGYVDEHYRPDDMSKKDCIEFCLKAVSQAMWRDHFSGGNVYMAIITEEDNEGDIERMRFKSDQIFKYNK